MAELRTLDAVTAQMALTILEEGDVVIAPTDTHYTILASPHSPEGCRRVYEVKERDPDFPLTVFLSSPEHLDRVARVSEPVRRLAHETWPGFLTLIVPKKTDAVPDHVTAGLPTVAVACHRHPDFRALLEMLGGYGACTSANRSGAGPDLVTLDDAAEQVADQVKLLIDGGQPIGSAGNTIVDLTSGVPVLVREGAVPAAQVKRLLPELVDNTTVYKNQLKRRQQSVATWRPTLQGRTALVTGAARGRGSELVRVLAMAGSTVFVGDKSADGVLVVDELRAQGLDAHFVQFDVTDPASWSQAATTVSGQSDGLDILVNNAGYCEGASITEASLDAWDLAFKVNATGAFLGIKAAVPLMRDGGSIVNVSSLFGLRTDRLTGVSYEASKGALLPLTRAAAADLAHRQIRVNAVAPGLIRTPLTEHHFQDSQTLAEINSRIPLGRPVDIADIVDAVLYLASPVSSYITGTVLPVDGGQLAT